MSLGIVLKYTCTIPGTGSVMLEAFGAREQDEAQDAAERSKMRVSVETMRLSIVLAQKATTEIDAWIWRALQTESMHFYEGLFCSARLGGFSRAESMHV